MHGAIIWAAGRLLPFACLRNVGSPFSFFILPFPGYSSKTQNPNFQHTTHTMTAATSSGTALPIKHVVLTFLLLSSLKYLLIPTYRSTDFDVHRNWLAITHHLPLSEWYFNDVNGGTVHTLDYPPLFAFFESFVSNNYITKGLLRSSGWLDERCLSLLPDVDNEPSDNCIKFHRCTVILSDAVLFIGAYLASTSMGSILRDNNNRPYNTLLTFLLIVTNPGLIMLDHVHFQYNGMLLGILLCSIACMIRGTNHTMDDTTTERPSEEKGETKTCQSHQLWELGGAATFAALLAMKHLYLTLAPLYLFYLLRHHCFIVKKEISYNNYKDRSEKHQGEMKFHFSWKRFVLLAGVTLICFLGPFIPFLMQSNPIEQLEQILKRLFPFGRGLVHDYWAANVWALYLFVSRVATFAFRRTPIPDDIRSLVEPFIPFPEPTPGLVAIILLTGLVPTMVYAWKVGTSSLKRWWQLNSFIPAMFFVHGVVFSSFSGFMLGFHVHEKAIMTAIIPLTLLATTSCYSARLFIRTSYLGIFALLPLLFRTEELLLKVALCITWLSGTIFTLELAVPKTKCNENLLTLFDYVAFFVMACLLLFMEVIHPIVFLPSGRLEFLPLMATSVACGVGLLYCWMESSVIMIVTATKR
jgi:alpha-1,3-glucosyltransferase